VTWNDRLIGNNDLTVMNRGPVIKQSTTMTMMAEQIMKCGVCG